MPAKLQLWSALPVYQGILENNLKNDKMKKQTFLLIGALLLCAGLQAQSDQTLFGNSGLHFSGIWGGGRVGLTSFDENYSVLRGGYFGLEFGKNVFVGWGGYRTTDEVAFGQGGPNDLDLDYNGLVLGYVPYAYKALHPQFMLLMGGGEVDLKDVGDDNVFVIQPSAGIEINVFRWFRLGLEGGYRFVTNTDLPAINDNDLSDFYGELKFKFGWSWGR